MHARVEVPEGWGWSRARILRGRLEDHGCWTEEYRMARGVVIHLTGSRATSIADPPAWQVSRI
jgi:hypothetical protein